MMSPNREEREQMPETTTELYVQVDLENDYGEKYTETSVGATTDEAIARVEALVAKRTGDDSYVMTDWRAAV